MRIRHAKVEDLTAVGQMAGHLVRLHNEFDRQRFMEIPDVEAGYAQYFAGELKDPKALLLVAEDDQHELAGYAYGRLEPRDWNALREACAMVHDLYVRDEYRHRGVGRMLLRGALDAFAERQAPRVMLSTATQNKAAQALFASMGFRATMIEMTCELAQRPDGHR